MNYNICLLYAGYRFGYIYFIQASSFEVYYLLKKMLSENFIYNRGYAHLHRFKSNLYLF